MRRQVYDLAMSIWRSANFVCGILLVAAWVIGLSHFEHLKETSPRIPIPSTGEVVPVNWKSVVVYMTASDARFDHWFSAVALAVIFTILAVTFWRSRERKKGD